ncbi:hypothetical protein K435DRAFT_854823 [Dendrothele bispora CBS 962.96]|uniref:Uncharacterized protein n=1 Tax=Dendrothele bispora (strain CBS 962.96) TaxID=1314807 RepID=A0A4S8MCU1_DENBC|nr:hypothetical protein K435DRAFT_854823 [Dendrothele bispora CBS 962.96]
MTTRTVSASSRTCPGSQGVTPGDLTRLGDTEESRLDAAKQSKGSGADPNSRPQRPVQPRPTRKPSPEPLQTTTDFALLLQVAMTDNYDDDLGIDDVHDGLAGDDEDEQEREGKEHQAESAITKPQSSQDTSTHAVQGGSQLELRHSTPSERPVTSALVGRKRSRSQLQSEDSDSGDEYQGLGVRTTSPRRPPKNRQRTQPYIPEIDQQVQVHPLPPHSNLHAHTEQNNLSSGAPDLSALSQSASEPSPSLSSAAVSDVSKEKLSRNRSRTLARAKSGLHLLKPTRCSLKRVRASIPLQTTVFTDDLITTQDAYVAKNGRKDDESHSNADVRYSVETLQSMGFELVKWDGITPRPILDCKGRIIGALAGRPKHENYTEACRDMYNKLMEVGESRQIKHHQSKLPPGRRGNFPAYNVGLSYGKGQKRPQRLKNEKNVAPLLDSLLDVKSVQNVASFQSATFLAWAPKLNRHYKVYLDKIYERLDLKARPNFARSVYPCCAFNFGGNVWTFKHRDSPNVAYGMCAITALGNFDPTKGGHLVLWELKLVVEFPPCSTILIPSATITHSNIPIAEGDTRLSFTQFCAGALFRWVDNGLRSNGEVQKVIGKDAFQELQLLRSSRPEACLELLSTLDELHAMPMSWAR